MENKENTVQVDEVKATEHPENNEQTIETIELEPVIDEKDLIIKNLQQELEKAKNDVTAFKDSWARERAEFQNYKRRSANENLLSKRDSVRNFVSKLLNAFDNLDRVSSASPTEELKPFLDGVDMIKKEFLTILEKENIYKQIPKSEVFDPSTMEAIASEESDEYKDEIVADVYQPGYISKENDVVFTLRPSRVKVGRPKN